MLSDEIIDKLTEKIAENIQETNTYILKQIAKNLSLFENLSITEAQQLAQMLKYGGSYEKIIFKLQQLTGLNRNQINKIFHIVAQNNLGFAEKFYKYRGIDYIPYEKNKALQRQIQAISNIALKEYGNISKTTGLGIVLQDKDGNKQFTFLRKAYNELIDRAVLSVSQGKDTFTNEMYRTIRELGGSGLKVEYASGNTRRLDSAVRMNLKQALRDMSNDLQIQFGKEFGADGVEISAHANPAPDHELLQGRQFDKENYEKLNNGDRAVSYDKVVIEADYKRRPISELNCYHYIFSIVLGVSEPIYNKEQLQEMIDKNNDGFELDGKKYTLYQGTQMQRKLETKIRELKDIQIMGVEAKQKEIVEKAQKQITAYTQKYKELSELSGLKTKMQRMRVQGYRRRNVKRM